ncbi:MAG: hypothetical protein ACYSTS_17690 [Planctomycetota bacterium]|jgi:hypothetical protein
MENKKGTMDMELKEKETGLFTSTVWLEAKSPEAKEFETTFVTSDSKETNAGRFKYVIKYIKDNNVNVLNKEKFKWL